MPLVSNTAANDFDRWLSQLLEEWIASRPGRGLRAGDGELSETSAQLYRDMWTVFSAHCGQLALHKRQGAQKDPLAQLTKADLQVLLEDPASKGRGTSSDHPWSERYAWRMLHLIDRILAFDAQRRGQPKNHAAHELLQEPPYRHANASHLDTAPELLTDGEVEQLINYLVSSSGVSETASSHRSSIQPRWKPARDAAVVATMLGAGLAPCDVQALQLGGVAIHDGPEPGVPWRLTVPADGLSPQHQAPLASWAGQLIAHWLSTRERMAVPGSYVFPSTLKGGGLSRMSCHRIAVNVLDAAGVPGGVPFRLRHTFAVRQLCLGHSEEVVGRWLGLVESKAMRRYVALATPGIGAS